MRQSTVDSRLKKIPEKTPALVDACFEKMMPQFMNFDQWKKAKRVRGREFSAIEEAVAAMGAKSNTVRRRLSRLPAWFTQTQVDDCFDTPRRRAKNSGRNSGGQNESLT
jgi:hypothetical protein